MLGSGSTLRQNNVSSCPTPRPGTSAMSLPDNDTPSTASIIMAVLFCLFLLMPRLPCCCSHRPACSTPCTRLSPSSTLLPPALHLLWPHSRQDDPQLALLPPSLPGVLCLLHRLGCLRCRPAAPSSVGRRRWVSKHTSSFCSVGSKLVKWKEQLTADWPCCTLHENVRHVWLCQEPAVFFVWALLMSLLSKWLVSVHTAKDITCWIIQRLTEWRSSEPLSPAQSDMPGLLQAIAAQDRIGWLAFFKGCVAVEWAGV
jgi:hypothetical protein